MPDTKSLESSIGIKFNNIHLLHQALIHRSFLNESKEFSESNERLEFLGDSVLSLITSRYLYERFPKYSEGELTNLRSILVRSKTLSEIGEELNLGQFLQMSRGERESGGSKNSALLANTVEAIIGSIYLDSNLDKVTEFLQHFLFPKVEEVLTTHEVYDFKSTVQERLQEKYKASPVYKVLATIGPDHDKTFTVGLYLGQKLLGKGLGKSKQAAEQEAAKDTLEKISD